MKIQSIIAVIVLILAIFVTIPHKNNTISGQGVDTSIVADLQSVSFEITIERFCKVKAADYKVNSPNFPLAKVQLWEGGTLIVEESISGNFFDDQLEQEVLNPNHPFVPGNEYHFALIAISESGISSPPDYVSSTCTPLQTDFPPYLTVDLDTITVSEGETAVNHGTVIDVNGQHVTMASSVDFTGRSHFTQDGIGGWTWEWVTDDGSANNQSIDIFASDPISTTQASFSLTVNNVAPTGMLSANPNTVDVNNPVTVEFTNSYDPSPVDTASGLLYSFDCTNDGVFEVTNSLSSFYICSYSDGGTYDIHGRIQDKDGDYNDETVSVTVNNSFPIPPECEGIVISNVIYGTENTDQDEDAIYGTEGNDLIFGLAGHDYIFGEGGDDCIFGGDGDDSIYGGEGNDRLFGENGHDGISGGNGNDTIEGGNQADTIEGDGGEDLLYGNAGNDCVFGGDGDDLIYGGEGSDAPLVGDGGDDVIYGGDGHDQLYGDGYDGGHAGGVVSGSGLAGNDQLYGETGNDYFDGGAGNDIINGGDDADNMFGGEGDDTINGGNGSDAFFGDGGYDTAQDFVMIDWICQDVEVGCDDDGDGIYNDQDACPNDPIHDAYNDPCNHDEDGDGVEDGADICHGADDTIDVDGDLIADCVDPLIDSDGDGVGDDADVCPGADDTIDVDGDLIADCVDPLIDSDGDGVGDDADVCPGADDTIDVDGDLIADCVDPLIDSDGDGVEDGADICHGADDTIDVDGDLIPDCNDPLIDSDGDLSADVDDCNPSDSSVYPGATEVPDDGIDQDCDGVDLFTPPLAPALSEETTWLPITDMLPSRM